MFTLSAPYLIPIGRVWIPDYGELCLRWLMPAEFTDLEGVCQALGLIQVDRANTLVDLGQPVDSTEEIINKTHPYIYFY